MANRSVTPVPLMVITKTDDVPTNRSGGRTADELEQVTTIHEDAVIVFHRPDGTSVNVKKSVFAELLVAQTHASGELYTDGGSTAQTGLGTTPELFTGFAVNGHSDNMTPDHTADSITVLEDGEYAISFQCSFSGSNSETFHYQAYKISETPPASIAGLAFTRKLGTGGDVGSGSFTGLDELVAGDVIAVYVDAGTASKELTAVDCQLAMHRVS